jgi:hypothetical protein
MHPPPAPVQDLSMPPRQCQEEAAPSSPAACSLLDIVALGPVQELIWSGLDSEDRQRLRETCSCLRDEVERSCVTLKHSRPRPSDEQAQLLVKLSRRMPRVRTLHLGCFEAVQALSLDPPPAGEQHACAQGTSAPPHPPSPESRCHYLPSLPAFS